jgi:hypothetical protein
VKRPGAFLDVEFNPLGRDASFRIREHHVAACDQAQLGAREDIDRVGEKSSFADDRICTWPVRCR